MGAAALKGGKGLLFGAAAFFSREQPSSQQVQPSSWQERPFPLQERTSFQLRFRPSFWYERLFSQLQSRPFPLQEQSLLFPATGSAFFLAAVAFFSTTDSALSVAGAAFFLGNSLSLRSWRKLLFSPDQWAQSSFLQERPFLRVQPSPGPWVSFSAAGAAASFTAVFFTAWINFLPCHNKPSFQISISDFTTHGLAPGDSRRGR